MKDETRAPQGDEMERAVVTAAGFGAIYGPDPTTWPAGALREVEAWLKKGMARLAAGERPTDDTRPPDGYLVCKPDSPYEYVRTPFVMRPFQTAETWRARGWEARPFWYAPPVGREAQLETALRWALAHIADGTDAGAGETPDHGCTLGTDAAHCDFHEQYFAAYALLTDAEG